MTIHKAFVTFSFLALLMCSTNLYAEDSAEHAHHAQPQMELPSEAPSAESLYHLTTQWTSSQNEQVRLSKFKGKPVVLFMAYTSCEFSCPIILGRAKRIEAALGPRAAETWFVFVSFDSVRDTPEALDAYAQKTSLTYDRWSLLHGSEDDVRELAVLLGIAFKKDAKDVFSHSNVITVLNRDGEIAHRQLGLTSDVSETVTELRLLLEDSKPRS